MEQPPTATRKIILDTDPALGVKFGVDFDDDLAIIFLLASPEIEIVGITTTYGNSTSGRTFRDAKALLARAGRTDIPVLQGAGWSSRDVHRETDASSFIRDTIAANPGRITVVTLGPLTNLAAAIRSAPGLMDHVPELVMMGGRLAAGKQEFNFSAHPAATAIALAAPCPQFIVTLDLCFQVAFKAKHLAALAKTGLVIEPWLPAVRRWLVINRAIVQVLSRLHPELTTGGFFPWDGIAVSYLVAPGLFFDVREMTMGMSGKAITLSDAPGNTRLPYKVDAEKFLVLFVDRIGSLYPKKN